MTKLLHFFLLFMDISYLRSLHVGFEFQGVEKDAFSNVERVWISLSLPQKTIGTGQLLLGFHQFGGKKLLAHLHTQGFFLCLMFVTTSRQQQGGEDYRDTQLLHFGGQSYEKTGEMPNL